MANMQNIALPIGTMLHSPEHDYKVVKVLGKGGFGITYMVTAEVRIKVGNVSQTVLTHFAIKEFFGHGCDRGADRRTMTFTSSLKEEVDQCLQDFITEAKRLNKIGTKSKNIVKVNEYFEANGTAYYVMEYLDGEDLSKYVKTHGAFSWGEAKNIIVPIAKAVGLLHEEKLLHLDIKPDNIMLKHDEAGHIVPVLIDFGIAKHFDSKGKPTSHLSAKGASDGYAPMEQYMGVDTFAPEMDVYALGATFLYLLTGNEPPKAGSRPNWAVLIRAQLPLLLSEREKSIVVDAMNQSRYERTRNVATLIAQLENKPIKVSETPKDENVETIHRGNVTQPIKNQQGFLARFFGKISKAGTELLKVEQKSEPAYKIFTVSGVSFKMINVEGGKFMMGANEGDSEAYGDENRHQVTLSDYYIGETEVTQALWKAVMGSNPSNFKGDNLPVEQVSWDDCQDFIRKLNAKTGATFSLPTEAQWEYAARGGNKSRGYKYSGSNSIDAVAWYDGNSGGKTHAVGTKQANELGIYDMSGNVYEWCSDRYGSYSSSSQTNPTGPSTGSYRVSRGGGWVNNAGICRVSIRGYGTPGYSGSDLGLRLSIRK